MTLITANNLTNADESYARLIAAHDRLTEAQSHALNACLVLIPMNQAGAAAVIAQAPDLARQGADAGGGALSQLAGAGRAAQARRAAHRPSAGRRPAE